ncbi:rhomboid family intramembrane serine protease [Marinobacterium nitratireducens]|uniref:Rhomboid family intramembrane serine protease n=1 Tax=Marinobacterium nitratireducens TaxID=518897 RepID=A0A918DRX5_9GAMM|nr:rhomboid family intramembrane serine protease [Marinobacterium nitratireducens]GGO81056.1 rhomboid family intramembrane serine protease [Marinobacterium nitratireducens]
MIKVLEVPLTEDLSGFTDVLWQQQVPHRVVERETTQELWVAPQVDAEQVLALYQHWRAGGDISGLRRARASGGGPFAPAVLRRTWLSLLLIGFSVLVSLLMGFGENLDWMRRFSIVEFQLRGDHVYYASLGQTLADGQWWRFLTPAFMHFNMPHLLFNLLWVWVAGRAIEALHGRWALVGLVVLSAVVSNLAQFWVSGPMFGGMSGVVFALLGYAWLWDRRGGRPAIGLPPALMGLMLLWLALGFTGVLESLGFGSIANTAHLAGLGAGLVWAFLWRGRVRR